MRQIISNLWFNTQAEEAVDFYLSLFNDSKIIEKTVLQNTPSGNAAYIEFTLSNLHFTAINGGPLFELNPSISIVVSCQSPQDVDNLHKKLVEGGTELMPLDTYPFSERYVWLVDRFGLSWQLMSEGKDYNPQQKLRLNLLFSGKVCGQAEKALEFYQSVFENAESRLTSHYSEDQEKDPRATISYSELLVNNDRIVINDHGMGGEFTFNEAYSLGVYCSSQAEVDYYWERLSHVPEAEECGWLKDQFGVSWQIVPTVMGDLLTNGTAEENQRVMEAMLQMKKIDIEQLENAKYRISG